MRRLAPFLIVALQGLACTIPDVPVPADGADASKEDAAARQRPDAAGDDVRGSDAALDEAGSAMFSDAGTGVAPGSPCPSAGAVACNGNAQKVMLLCTGGLWSVASTCANGQNCDSRPGATQGTCAIIDPACAGASPGDRVCSTNADVVQCGPDLVSHSDVKTCAGQACLAGDCAGACSPGSTQCAGNGVATCGTSGIAGAAVACTNSTCSMGMCTGSCSTGATQCSGNSAVQSCVSGTWGPAQACTDMACVSGACVGLCSPGATRCSGNGVETCDTSGAWSAAVGCTNKTCVSGPGTGTCAGVCAPGQTNPVACGNCGTDAQTCSSNGAWQSSGTCAGQGACSGGATQACNTYGTQACSVTCAWGGCSCGSAPNCTPSATKCAGNGVQTCSACGQWGGTIACASGQSCSGGSCVTIQSCQTSGEGLTNCGANVESCCTSLEVPGGTYERTYTNSGSGPTGEADPATVSSFRLDKYDVTVGRFRQFVAAWNNGTGYTPPAGSGKHTHLNGGKGLANSASAGTYETGWVTSDDSNIAPTTANLTNSGMDASATWTSPPGNRRTCRSTA